MFYTLVWLINMTEYGMGWDTEQFENVLESERFVSGTKTVSKLSI